MKYGLFGKFVAHDGKRDELSAILLQAADLLEQNDQCISYVVGIVDGTNDVWVSELWENKEVHDSSLKLEDIRNLIMTARPLIRDIAPGTEFQVLGGKNSENNVSKLVSPIA